MNKRRRYEMERKEDDTWLKNEHGKQTDGSQRTSTGSIRMARSRFGRTGTTDFWFRSCSSSLIHATEMHKLLFLFFLYLVGSERAVDCCFVVSEKKTLI
jgi:hypothetical protein